MPPIMPGDLARQQGPHGRELLLGRAAVDEYGIVEAQGGQTL